MLFNSIEFLIFFVIVTALFFILPKKCRNYLLLAASYVFYAWWNWKLLFLIAFTTLVSYGAGLYLAYRPKGRKLVFAGAVVLIVGALLFFKYYNFFARGIGFLANSISGNSFDFTLDILLPVGISFYTFQTLSYVIDVYRGTIEPERNIAIYALFVSFFPQLVAGPIERPNDLIPQLKAEHTFNPDDVTEGFRMMVIGFFEKIAVADVVGVLVNKVYEHIAEANGLLVLVATVLFSVQILCDFKGYSDIAKGIARIYGIRLSDNFDHPYGARSVREFWRKWHMTLSYWFRDYVYIPLGGSHVPFARYCLNILIVFAISGLWHGAALTFLLWGVLHAVYQIVEKLVDKIRLRRGGGTLKPDTKVVAALRTVLTFVLVTIAWILFRSNSLSDCGLAFAKLFTDWQATGAYFRYAYDYLALSWQKVLGIALVLTIFATSGPLLKRLDVEGASRAKRVGKVAVYAVMMIVTITCFLYLKSIDVASSFIYFQF